MLTYDDLLKSQLDGFAKECMNTPARELGEEKRFREFKVMHIVLKDAKALDLTTRRMRLELALRELVDHAAEFSTIRAVAWTGALRTTAVTLVGALTS